MNSLDSFCGIENGSFRFWNTESKNFGLCFEYLAIVCPANVILLLISIFYTGKKPLTSTSREFEIPIFVKLRIVISCFIALESLIEIICIILVQPKHPVVIILTNSLIAVAWIFNSLSLWKIRVTFLIQKCLPRALLVSTVLVLLASLFHLYSVINAILNHSSYHSVSDYGTIARFTLLLIYLMSLVNCGVNDNVFHNSIPHVNAPAIQADDSNEHNRLLRSISQGTYYSSIQCVSDDLGVAEDPYNPLSKLCFWWVKYLMLKGYKGLIQSEEDLFMLPKALRTSHIQDVFLKEFYWSPRELSGTRTPASSKTSCSTDFDDSCSSYVDVKFSSSGGDDVFYTGYRTQRTLLSALHHSFGWQYYCLGILKLLSDGLGFAGPLLLHALVSFIENKKEPMTHGYYYATGLLISTLLCAFLNVHFSYWVNKVGLKMRAAIITTVYQKALSVSSASLTEFSTGEVVNFMSTDTDRVVNFCPSFHQFWSLPFQVAVSLYLLHQQVGLSFLAGLGFAIIVIPINRWLAIKIQALSKDMMTKKDCRVKMMNEILYGIRVIKFYAWERNFEMKIDDIRSEELKSLKGRKYLDAWCVYFWATTPVIISILTFTTYALLGNTLTAAKVFTSVALFNMLISPLNAFPWVLNGLMEAWVSIQRLQAYLELKDLDLSAYYSDMNSEDMRQTAVKIVSGQFTWKKRENYREEKRDDISNDDSTIMPGASDTVGCLSNINATLEKRQLIGVIGMVGSGKSSFLSAITAEIDKIGGQVFVSCLDNGFGLAAQDTLGVPYVFPHYREMLVEALLSGEVPFRGSSLINLQDLKELSGKGKNPIDNWLSNFVIDEYLRLMPCQESCNVKVLNWKIFDRSPADIIAAKLGSLQGHDCILVPCNPGQSHHWFLLATFPELQLAVTLDSAAGHINPTTQATLEKCRDVVSLLATNSHDWLYHTNSPSDIPQQHNAYDYGVFVCLYARALILGDPVLHREELSGFRKMMILELHRKSLGLIPLQELELESYYAMDYITKFYIGRILDVNKSGGSVGI